MAHSCLLLDRAELNRQFDAQELSFEAIITAWLYTLANRYDVVACFEGKNRLMTGPVGLGKSSNAQVFAQCLSHEQEYHLDATPYNPWTDTVIRDDLGQWSDCLERREPYQILVADEAEWFLYKQWWSKPAIKRLTPEFMSNRKETRAYFLLIPKMRGMVEFFRNDRVGWDFQCTDRGVFLLRVNNDRFDWNKGWWGAEMGGVTGIPACPEWLWDVYEERVGQHQDMERQLRAHVRSCPKPRSCQTCNDVRCVSFAY